METSPLRSPASGRIIVVVAVYRPPSHLLGSQSPPFLSGVIMALKKSNETGKGVHEVAQWSRHGTRTARKTYLNLGVGKYFSPWTQLQSRPLFSSVQDRIYALGKAHIRSTPSLRSFPNVGFETVPVLV